MCIENEMQHTWHITRGKCGGMNQDAIPLSWHRTAFPPGKPLSFNPFVAQCTWHLRTISQEEMTKKSTI